MHPARQLDVMKLIVVFQNFANVPKNDTVGCLTRVLYITLFYSY